jgi:hypothetical protein
MALVRLWAAVALAVGLFAVTSETSAQPPSGATGPQVGAPGGEPARPAAVPLVPKSAAAFITLKVSDLLAHPDAKATLADLAKQPDALDGITETIGVSPLAVDRLTLFWSHFDPADNVTPVMVVATREPFNEARVLKTLGAVPVYDTDFRRGRVDRAPDARPQPDLRKAPEAADAPLPPKSADKAPAAPEMPPPPVVKPEDGACGGSPDSGPGEPLYYAISHRPFGALLLIDERTFVLLPGGPENESVNLALLAALMKKTATGPLADAIAAAGKHTFAAGVNFSSVVRGLDLDRRTPPGLVPYVALFAARTAVLTADLDKSAAVAFALSFDDAAAARRAAPVLEEGIATVAEKFGGMLDDLRRSTRPEEKAFLPFATALAAGLKKATVTADGSAVTARTTVDFGPAAAQALVELLKTQPGRKKVQARINNLKQIGVALHAYHDANGAFPTNVYGPKGEPLLSWRVKLLPYLDQAELYSQFKMDEPWDGENNKKLIEKMPNVFAAPHREPVKGKTYYQGFSAADPLKTKPVKGLTGRPWLRDGDSKGIRFLDIVDGTSNTLAVIEARDGVVWSKPQDLSFGGAVPALGENGTGETPSLRFDGSVLLFPSTLAADDFWPYVTIDGGEVRPDPSTLRRSDHMAPPEREPVPKAPGTAEQRLRESELRLLEQQVAELTELQRRAEAEAAAARAKETAAAVASGTATAEQVARAQGLAAAARKVAVAHRTELERERERLKAAREALEKGAKPPSPGK